MIDRLGVCLAASAVALLATGADACSIVENGRTEPNAFRAADMVLTVDALTQDLQPVPGQPSLLIGSATARVTEVFKGRERVGGIIAYRVVAGEDAVGCPARSDTTPGRTYRLYLKFEPGSGPPIIVRRQPLFDKAGR